MCVCRTNDCKICHRDISGERIGLGSIERLLIAFNDGTMSVMATDCVVVQTNLDLRNFNLSLLKKGLYM